MYGLKLQSGRIDCTARRIKGGNQMFIGSYLLMVGFLIIGVVIGTASTEKEK